MQHFGLQNIASSRRQGSVRTEETIRNATVPDTSGSQSPKRLTPVAEPQTPKFSHLATTNVSGVLEEEVRCSLKHAYHLICRWFSTIFKYVFQIVYFK